MAEMDGKSLGKAYDVPVRIYPHSQGAVAVDAGRINDMVC